MMNILTPTSSTERDSPKLTLNKETSNRETATEEIIIHGLSKGEINGISNNARISRTNHSRHSQ